MAFVREIGWRKMWLQTYLSESNKKMNPFEGPHEIFLYI